MEQPSPPTSLPKYLAEGLPKHETDTLTATGFSPVQSVLEKGSRRG
jgi:hypothetical protein